mmetsp:Transcript_40461/g.87616  ORF Transcript_40461/g.87616 Transcript_40461/m.87616 type:complete len:200 (+) Transcript_40461:1261-1860(+)
MHGGPVASAQYLAGLREFLHQVLQDVKVVVKGRHVDRCEAGEVAVPCLTVLETLHFQQLRVSFRTQLGEGEVPGKRRHVQQSPASAIDDLQKTMASLDKELHHLDMVSPGGQMRCSVAFPVLHHDEFRTEVHQELHRLQISLHGCKMQHREPSLCLFLQQLGTKAAKKLQHSQAAPGACYMQWGDLCPAFRVDSVRQLS